MRKFNFKNLILYIIITFDFFSISILRVQAQFLKDDLNLRNKQEFREKKSDRKYNVKKSFLNLLKKDLINSDNPIFNILVADNTGNTNNFSIDIEADIQSQNKDSFIAEGNAIVYLSNGKLAADKITYDKKNKVLSAEGNIFFFKGQQYFEASYFYYDLNTKEGYVNDIYGVLEIASINEDFELKKLKKDNNQIFEYQNNNLDDLVYINSASLGLVNDFEENKQFNITDLDLSVPQIPRWRFKAEKLTLTNKTLKSDLIFFTNDPINKPQFILENRNFTAKVVDDKSQLISRNTWVILDNKIKFPIGRRNIVDREPLTKWGLGSDFSEKDGWYIYRGLERIKISDDFSLQLQPYFLVQRSIKGKSDSFWESNSSIFSPKVKKENYFLDNFALDMDLKGKLNKWDLFWDTSFNSLNPTRIDQSVRTKLTLKKSFDLNQKDTIDDLLIKDNKVDKNYFRNFADFKVYSSYRETVSKGYEGDSEIYFGYGTSIANRKEWYFNNVNTSLAFIYDLGQFNAKSKTANELKNLTRNVFAAKFNYKFPIWEKGNLDKSINSKYKYTPSVIKEAFNWSSTIQSGVFIYSSGDNQSGLIFNTGPELTLGRFVENSFDYTKINLNYSYALKDGESPFEFDNIGSSTKLQLNLEQQLIGPLLFSYETSLNLETGEFSKPNYGMDFKRRAYSVGAFYNTSSKSVGIKFNIFNFDYSGVSSNF